MSATCAPVAWAGGRWPHHAWRNGELIWVSWETETRLSWRGLRERKGPSSSLIVRGSADSTMDRDWATRCLGLAEPCPAFPDERIEAIRRRYPGLRPLADGALYEGLILAIVGQSISVAAAAVTAARLAALFDPGIEIEGRHYWPLPRADQLAEADVALVRQSGVTWRRAEALVAMANAAIAGRLPDWQTAQASPDQTRMILRSLKLVGPWTAEATLLWGIGLPDAHVTGDVALLRAARRCYERPELTLKELDQLADNWRPARAWAARLLWADLFGEAETNSNFGALAALP